MARAYDLLFGEQPTTPNLGSSLATGIINPIDIGMRAGAGFTKQTVNPLDTAKEMAFGTLRSAPSAMGLPPLMTPLNEPGAMEVAGKIAMPAYGIYQTTKNSLVRAALGEPFSLGKSALEDRSIREIPAINTFLTSDAFVNTLKTGLSQGFNVLRRVNPNVGPAIPILRQLIEQATPEQMAALAEVTVDIPAMMGVSKMNEVAKRAVGWRLGEKLVEALSPRAPGGPAGAFVNKAGDPISQLNPEQWEKVRRFAPKLMEEMAAHSSWWRIMKRVFKEVDTGIRPTFSQLALPAPSGLFGGSQSGQLRISGKGTTNIGEVKVPNAALKKMFEGDLTLKAAVKKLGIADDVINQAFTKLTGEQYGVQAKEWEEAKEKKGKITKFNTADYYKKMRVASNPDQIDKLMAKAEEFRGTEPMAVAELSDFADELKLSMQSSAPAPTAAPTPMAASADTYQNSLIAGLPTEIQAVFALPEEKGGFGGWMRKQVELLAKDPTKFNEVRDGMMERAATLKGTTITPKVSEGKTADDRQIIEDFVKKAERKKPTPQTLAGDILAQGGINEATLSDYDIKILTQNGMGYMIRKTGGIMALDKYAQELAGRYPGIFRSSDPMDFMRELVETLQTKVGRTRRLDSAGEELVKEAEKKMSEGQKAIRKAEIEKEKKLREERRVDKDNARAVSNIFGGAKTPEELHAAIQSVESGQFTNQQIIAEVNKAKERLRQLTVGQQMKDLKGVFEAKLENDDLRWQTIQQLRETIPASKEEKALISELLKPYRNWDVITTKTQERFTRFLKSLLDRGLDQTDIATLLDDYNINPEKLEEQNTINFILAAREQYQFIKWAQERKVATTNPLIEKQAKALTTQGGGTGTVFRKLMHNVNAKYPESATGINPLLSIRYYIQAVEQCASGLADGFYDFWVTHISRANIKISKMIYDAQHALEKMPGFYEVVTNKDALQRISDYISSKSNLENAPESPDDITPEEEAIAKELERGLEEAKPLVRFMRIVRNDPIPDADPDELAKAQEIYELQGPEALMDYCKTIEWGVMKSGYEPLSVLRPALVLQAGAPSASKIGTGHIKTRTAIEYKRQDRTIFQRYNTYLKQIYGLVYLQPSINHWTHMFDKATAKLPNAMGVARDLAKHLEAIKGYYPGEGTLAVALRKIYNYTSACLIGLKPLSWIRNRLNNVLYPRIQEIFLRHRPLTKAEVEECKDYCWQERPLLEYYMLQGDEKPMRGMRSLVQWARKVRVFPWIDNTNRIEAWSAKALAVERAYKSFQTHNDMDRFIKEAHFNDLESLEQKHALILLVTNGIEDCKNYMATQLTHNTNFVYDWTQRSPAELGDRTLSNLMAFPRGYAELFIKNSEKVLNDKLPHADRWEALKSVLMVFLMIGLSGEVYKKATGDKSNPYAPASVLMWSPGGLLVGAWTDFMTTAYQMQQAMKGDKNALNQAINGLAQVPQMTVPGLKIFLNIAEGAMGIRKIDTYAIKKMISLIDQRYRVVARNYEVQRSIINAWQHALLGTDPAYQEILNRKNRRGGGGFSFSVWDKNPAPVPANMPRRDVEKPRAYDILFGEGEKKSSRAYEQLFK